MNPYEILEIRPGATAEELKTAYHRLAKQWHPDRFTGEQKTQAEQKFRQLTEAFNMLKSAVPRAPEPPPQTAAPVSPSAPTPPPFEPTATGSIKLDTNPAPSSVQDWYNKAKILFDTKCNQEALGYIQYALKLEQEKYDYHLLHAKILEAIGSDKRAMVAALEHCLRLNNKDADSAIKLAETYQGLGMYSRATRYWEWAANLAPEHPYFLKQKASAKERAQETAEGLGSQFRLLVEQAKDFIGKFTKR